MMRRTGTFIDANLLVVLVVGLVDRKLVGKRRRTRTFTPENYDRLLVEIGDLPIFVTPNTLTEASNLLEDPEDTRFLDQLRVLIEISKEIVVDSSTAAQEQRFHTAWTSRHRASGGHIGGTGHCSPWIPRFTELLCQREEASAVNFTYLQNL